MTTCRWLALPLSFVGHETTCNICHIAIHESNQSQRMADLSLADPLGGFPEPPHRNPALASSLLESLYAIDAECTAMYYASPHYSTRHAHAIRRSVAEMVAENRRSPGGVSHRSASSPPKYLRCIRTPFTMFLKIAASFCDRSRDCRR